MIRHRLATITGVSDRSMLVTFSVQYRGMPVDFGFDKCRLRSFSPEFYITEVAGFAPNKLPADYKEFGAHGLAKGVKVLCEVDDTVPQGLISNVRPPRRRKK